MKKSVFNDFIKPIIVLATICIVTSALLALTNSITAPIILESELQAAQEQRNALLPAKSFTKLETTIEGVTEVYKAEDDLGYVITAEANGYNGAVPVMVAFSSDGNILGVSFLPNTETPGFGQKVREEKFQIQFAKMPAQTITLSEIDAVSGATVSSSAAVEALNRAIKAYGQAHGIDTQPGAVNLSTEDIHEHVLPNAGEITEVEAQDENVLKVFKGESYGTIVYTQQEGYKGEPITAVVGFDDDGTITGVWFDAKGETAGLGDQVATNPEFAQGFIGDKDTATTDAIAQATVSSNAAIAAVEKAIQYIKTTL